MKFHVLPQADTFEACNVQGKAASCKALKLFPDLKHFATAKEALQYLELSGASAGELVTPLSLWGREGVLVEVPAFPQVYFTSSDITMPNYSNLLGANFRGGMRSNTLTPTVVKQIVRDRTGHPHAVSCYQTSLPRDVFVQDNLAVVGMVETVEDKFIIRLHPEEFFTPGPLQEECFHCGWPLLEGGSSFSPKHFLVTLAGVQNFVHGACLIKYLRIISPMPGPEEKFLTDFSSSIIHSYELSHRWPSLFPNDFIFKQDNLVYGTREVLALSWALSGNASGYKSVGLHGNASTKALLQDLLREDLDSKNPSKVLQTLVEAASRVDCDALMREAQAGTHTSRSSFSKEWTDKVFSYLEDPTVTFKDVALVASSLVLIASFRQEFPPSQEVLARGHVLTSREVKLLEVKEEAFFLGEALQETCTYWGLMADSTGKNFHSLQWTEAGKAAVTLKTPLGASRHLHRAVVGDVFEANESKLVLLEEVEGE